LARFADKTKYKLRLDPIAIEDILSSGNGAYNIRPTSILHDEDICRYKPFENSEYR
jgi:hypothetical protein